MNELITGYLNGNRRSLARLITLIENNSQQSSEILDQLFQRMGHAYRIGITGPPGAGKSTIVDQLTKIYRRHNKTVAIIAVDPTSPFTGGALLGDRIRMSDLSTDSNVFIRSMASRGSLGGLSERTQEVADLLDAFGFDIVIIETVGVGQSELDIAQAADSTVVVVVPESGDVIQAMKAGLMEIADVLAINKSDRPGAERLLLEIESVFNLRNQDQRWKIPIIQTIANQNSGIEELYNQLQRHFNFQSQSEVLADKKKKRIENYIQQKIQQKLLQVFWQSDRRHALLIQLDDIVNKHLSPYKVSEELFNDFMANFDYQDK